MPKNGKDCADKEENPCGTERPVQIRATRMAGTAESSHLAVTNNGTVIPRRDAD